MVKLIKFILKKDQYINIESIKNSKVNLLEMFDTILILLDEYKTDVNKTRVLTLQLLLTISYIKRIEVKR